MAEAYRKAADQCEVSRDKAGDDVSWHNCAQSIALKIEALTDTDALAEVQALRAERDHWHEGWKQAMGEFDAKCKEANAQRDRAEAAEAELAATQAKLAGVVEALTESVEVVHKAYVAATMEAVNAGSSHPLTGQMDAWRVRCMKAEAHARAALEGAKP